MFTSSQLQASSYSAILTVNAPDPPPWRVSNQAMSCLNTDRRKESLILRTILSALAFKQVTKT